MTILFSVLSLALMALLGWAAFRHRTPQVAAPQSAALDLKEFGPQATNRWLIGFRLFLLVLVAGVVAMHCYWAYSAGNDPKSNFSMAKRLDGRNLRLAESGLKGWVLDRTGKLENALIRYRYDGGLIHREYPLGAAGLHLTGYSDYVFGSGGMEYGLRKWLSQPASTTNELTSPVPVGKDLKVSIDSSLQRSVYDLLQASGKPSAAVVLLLPNNEVLAMASSPSVDPSQISNEDNWRDLTDQAQNTPELSPLVNRALGTLVTGGAAFYYRPGSTFKVFTAAVAIDSGMTNEKFTCRGEGFTPPGSGRPIRDFEGEVHGTIGFDEAFKVSCNQYFAQLGLKLGKERMANYARRLDFAIAPDDDRLRARDLWQTGHADDGDFNFIFAPPIGRMNLSRSASSYDVALESFGQGYDDMTVFKMALIAAAAANPNGMLAAPTFEPGQTKTIGQFISAQSAAELRKIMRMVVQSGTAAGAFAHLNGRIPAAGKTGTADRDVPVYDKAGNQVVDYVDREGRQHYKTQGWTDGWFIGFAPADNPQIAFAVLVENGGQGAHSAAPIAVKIIEQSAALGYVKP
ncbi:MAG TPA: penicillin-binding transpeptidase domain-containing protein [Blastocatellia bacterium]|nr:penicillin-binding transpeptidase domain-containing protein [Blastocatellia bacterium]